MLGIAAQNINLGEYNEPGYGKTMREMSSEALALFNNDLRSLAAEWAAEPIRMALERIQDRALIVCRNVMYKAGQPYGGSLAVGDEITMRILKPVDLAFTIEEYWDLNLSGEAVGDIWGYQAGGTTPANDTIGEEEGNIVFGWINKSTLQPFSSYQFIKAGKTFGWYTMNFDICRPDSVPFVETQAPLLEFPEDSVRIQMDVARLDAVARLIAVGIHFCRASAIASATAATGSA